MADVSAVQVEDALRELDLPRPRPTPLLWLKYAVQGTLPARFDRWVLHDVTCRTWVLRQGARALVLLALPVLAVLLFVPVSVGMRLMIVLNAGLPALLASLLMTLNATERRLARAGYPSELGQAIRQKRAVDKQNLGNKARRERIAARQARR